MTYLPDLNLKLFAASGHITLLVPLVTPYADDIVLLAPSASALRMMLNTCCQFAKDHNLLFNANKTQLVCFSSPSSSPIPSSAPIFLFEGQPLSLASKASHLGHILRSDLCDSDDIFKGAN